MGGIVAAQVQRNAMILLLWCIEWCYGIACDQYSCISMHEQDEEIVPSPTKTTSFASSDDLGQPSGEVVSLSGSLKRGLKMKDQAETGSLSGTLKRGFRKHGIKNMEGLQNTSPDPQSSPRSSKGFIFKSPKKSKRGSGYNDDTMSITSKTTRDSRHYRGNSLRVDDVIPYSSPFDDTVSMIEGLLVNTTPLRQKDGIRDTISRKEVVTLKKMIKVERPLGDGRTDAKVLILTPYRCQVLGVKSPFKMEENFHFLDIKSMDSSSPERLQISTHNGKIYFMHMIGTDDADHIIGRVALSLRTIFPNVALSRILKASLEPLHRQKVIQTMLNQADQTESGPCGNFSEMYQCVCDYLNCSVREDIQWDVDTIYSSQNCHEINLKDFNLSETKDIVPVVSIFIYNRWFNSLTARNMKLSNEVLEYILKVARRSHNLKQLTLDGVGVKGDFSMKLSSNLVKNKESCIESLDLSNNPLEDKGVLHLSGSLPVMKHGSIKRLNLSRTGLTARGINGLCQSMRSSQNIMTSLTHLNLSGNCIRSDEAEGLHNFLSSDNHITDLDLSSTDCSVEVYVSALAKGCLKHLENISLARNHVYAKSGMGSRYYHFMEDEYSNMKKNKENSLPASFQEFFRDTTALKVMDFSSMRFPPEALRCVMEGLLSNTTPGLKVSLDLSRCELKSSGCEIIQSSIGSLRNVIKLDISDNSFDYDLTMLLMTIQRNKFLKELFIGKNFFGIKPKNMKEVMEAIVELVQEEDSGLESLSLADSKIKDCMNTLLGCLGSNTSLTSLDISGNFMGDDGSRVLAKSLQINTKLKILKLDRNNLTVLGFHDIAASLEKNYSLRYIPYPVNDAVAAMKNQPERTQLELARMQDLLLRNANANKTSNDQQFRLQSVVSTTAQQVLDKVAEKVDDIVNALEILEADSACSDVVINAKNLVKDAKNSKSLLTNIYGLGMEKSVGESSQLQTKLNKMASAVDTVVNQHVKGIMDAMKQSTEAQCPHVYKEIKNQLDVTVEERCQLPRDCIKKCVMNSSGIEIGNKVSELNLSVSTLISDKVTDTLLAALTQCNVALAEQLNKIKQEREVGTSLAASSQPESPLSYNEDFDASSLQPSVTFPDVIVMDRSPEDDLLPNMRKERAASVAKRRQRPITSPTKATENTPESSFPTKKSSAGSLDALHLPEDDDEKKITTFGGEEPKIKIQEEVEKYKNVKEIKEEKEERESAKTTSEEEPKSKIKEKVKKHKKVEKIKEEKNIKAEKHKKVKKKKVAETKEENEVEKIKEENTRRMAETKEENEVEEIKEENTRRMAETKEENEVEEIKGEKEKKEGAKTTSETIDQLPEVTEQKVLEHVTKNRPRGPTRRPRRPPSRAKQVSKEENVDDFFNNNVSNTDFSSTPTIEEEAVIQEKEKLEEEKIPKKVAGMPLVTPDMLKIKKKQGEGEETENIQSTGDEMKAERSPMKRPKGTMVMPGMGFGGNLFAEMKLKKLTKKSESDDGSPLSPHKSKSGENSPVRSGMIRKSSESSDVQENSNENNNNNTGTSPGKSSFFSRIRTKSRKQVRPMSDCLESSFAAASFYRPFSLRKQRKRGQS